MEKQAPAKTNATQKPEPHCAKMAVAHDCASGLEVDARGNPIPLRERTATDQVRARTGDRKAEG